MAFLFENLHVYRRAVDFADRIIHRTKGAPRGFGFLTDQLNRAALSISTNLAEGNGRFTRADRRNFFTIARGSVHECIPLLAVAARHGIVADGEHAALRAELEEIARMLSGLIAGLENRRPGQVVEGQEAKLESKPGRRLRPLPRGRPRKDG